MSRAYDAIVVGSGFRGGVTACRLAENGWRVCVLERGRRFGPDDWPEHPGQAPRMFWHHRLNPAGFYDLRLMKDVAVLTAAGVGGGSLIYANVQLPAPPEVFEHPPWPAEIDRDALDPYYVRTQSALDPQTTPSEPHLAKVAAFAAAGRRAGRTPERLPLAIHFGEDREHPFSGVRQQGCTNLGRCNIGCPRNAMNTVAITYVARAEQHGAEVLPLCEVLRIEPPARSGGNWRAGFRNLENGGKDTVEAPVLVLSAGTIGTPRLLLTNRRRLSRLSNALGSNFSGNGDALGAAFDPHESDVKGAHTEHGPVMTSRLDYTADGQFMLADGGLPEGWTGLLKVARGLSAIEGWRRRLLQLKSAAARAGATDVSLAPRHVGPSIFDDPEPITDSLVFLMIGRDLAHGRMRLTPLLRRFDIQWSREDNAALFDGMRKATREVADGADATDWFEPDGGPLGKYMTVHPLGGAPMADDPADGVVDQHGKVYGYDGLYVADGSMVPSALGVNPSKTIAALAERSVEHLLGERSR